MEELNDKIENVISINAREIAEELGEPRSQNIVMLGMTITALELNDIDWVSIIKKFLPERFHEVNIKALERGLEQGKVIA